MSPRKRLGKSAWKVWRYEFLTRFFRKCEIVLYVTICVLAYRVFLEMIPGKLAEVILWIMLIEGVPLGQPGNKVATLIRGLLKLIEALDGNLPDNVN